MKSWACDWFRSLCMRELLRIRAFVAQFSTLIQPSFLGAVEPLTYWTAWCNCRRCWWTCAWSFLNNEYFLKLLLCHLEDSLQCAHNLSDWRQPWIQLKVNSRTELTARYFNFKVCNSFINFLLCWISRGRKWNLSDYYVYMVRVYKSQCSSVRAVKNHLCSIEG